MCGRLLMSFRSFFDNEIYLKKLHCSCFVRTKATRWTNWRHTSFFMYLLSFSRLKHHKLPGFWLYTNGVKKLYMWCTFICTMSSLLPRKRRLWKPERNARIVQNGRGLYDLFIFNTVSNCNCLYSIYSKFGQFTVYE